MTRAKIIKLQIKRTRIELIVSASDSLHKVINSTIFIPTIVSTEKKMKNKMIEREQHFSLKILQTT